MRAVFTARLVWLVMEISDNSREMEKYDQPESHALCHHKPGSGLAVWICLSSTRLVVFFPCCNRRILNARISARPPPPSFSSSSPSWVPPGHYFSVLSRCHSALKSSVSGFCDMDRVMTPPPPPLQMRFTDVDPVCAVHGCLAHVFPLIKDNTHARTHARSEEISDSDPI